MEETWTRVDAYVEATLHEHDDALDAALAAGIAAGLPQIQVSTPHAKLLHLLARSLRAERILEIGTLAGYSGIWLARALQAGGRLVTIEVDQRHAEVARSNFETAGVADVVDLRVGPALSLLPLIEEEGLGPFDLSFIDADKANNPSYIDWAVRMSRSGSLIIVDNVVRGGAVLDPEGDERTQGTRAAFSRLGTLESLDATAIQTVGSKGYDGFAVAIVR